MIKYLFMLSMLILGYCGVAPASENSDSDNVIVEESLEEKEPEKEPDIQDVFRKNFLKIYGDTVFIQSSSDWRLVISKDGTKMSSKYSTYVFTYFESCSDVRYEMRREYSDAVLERGVFRINVNYTAVLIPDNGSVEYFRYYE